MDRIDLVVEVDRPEPGRMLGEDAGTDSASLRTQVQEAREWASTRGGPSSRLSGTALLQACDLDLSGRRALEHAAAHHHLSGRGVTRLLRVARTIADLERAPTVSLDHLAEALGYRIASRQ